MCAHHDHSIHMYPRKPGGVEAIQLARSCGVLMDLDGSGRFPADGLHRAGAEVRVRCFAAYDPRPMLQARSPNLSLSAALVANAAFLGYVEPVKVRSMLRVSFGSRSLTFQSRCDVTLENV